MEVVWYFRDVTSPRDVTRGAAGAASGDDSFPKQTGRMEVRDLIRCGSRDLRESKTGSLLWLGRTMEGGV